MTGEPSGRDPADDEAEHRGGDEATGDVPLSGLSAAEFVRLARLRRGLNPDLPTEGEDEDGEGSWFTGATAGEDAGGQQPDPDTTRSGRKEPGPGTTRSGWKEPEPDTARPGWRDPERDVPRAAWERPQWGSWPGGSGDRPGSDHWPSGSARTGGYCDDVAPLVEVLDTMEPARHLDDEARSERLADLVRVRSRLDAAIAADLQVWDADGVWGGDGSKSPGARLARDADCAKSTAGGQVGLARDVGRMALTAAAWRDGRLSTDHVRRLARACTDERWARFCADEERLIATAVDLAGDYARFHRAVTVWEQYCDDLLHDPTDPDDVPKADKQRHTDRHGKMRESDHGFDLEASLTRVGGEIVRNQLQRIVDELWKHDWDDARARLGDRAAICEADLARTHQQRWADAIVEMATRAGAWNCGDVRPKPLITVHVTATEMCGPVRETFNGVVMTRRDVADLLGEEADWERIIYGPDGQPTDLTSVQRNFTGALRRAVQLRDRVCQHPTCDVDAERCHVDHIVEFSDGGPTNIENARCLCPKHNHQRPGRGKKPPPRGDSDGSDADDADGYPGAT